MGVSRENADRVRAGEKGLEGDMLPEEAKKRHRGRKRNTPGKGSSPWALFFYEFPL